MAWENNNDRLCKHPRQAVSALSQNLDILSLWRPRILFSQSSPVIYTCPPCGLSTHSLSPVSLSSILGTIPNPRVPAANTFSTPKSPFALHAVSPFPNYPIRFNPLGAQGWHVCYPNKGRKWFDCAECHYEQEPHALAKSSDMVACPSPSPCFHSPYTYDMYILLHFEYGRFWQYRHSPAKNARNVSGKTHRSLKRGIYPPLVPYIRLICLLLKYANTLLLNQWRILPALR